MTRTEMEDLELEILDLEFFKEKQFFVRGELNEEEFKEWKYRINNLLKELKRSWRKIEYIDFINKIESN